MQIGMCCALHFMNIVRAAWQCPAAGAEVGRWKVEGMWKVVRLLFIGMYHMIDWSDQY